MQATYEELAKAQAYLEALNRSGKPPRLVSTADLVVVPQANGERKILIRPICKGCGKRMVLPPFKLARGQEYCNITCRYDSKTMAQRFWDNVTALGKDDCWLWRGRKTKQGYGKICTRGKAFLASRVSLEIHERPPKDSKEFALHRCDTPACVNPNHLFWGTQLENMQDMKRKGRARHGGGTMRGEQIGNSKLTEKQVRLIRYMHLEFGLSIGALATLCGVCNLTISKIVTRKTWAHVADRKKKYPNLFP